MTGTTASPPRPVAITWYAHGHLDEVELVRSGEFPGRAYPCPTLERLDEHLRVLSGHLGPPSNLTDAAKVRVRRDMDRLLERRQYLRRAS